MLFNLDPVKVKEVYLSLETVFFCYFLLILGFNLMLLVTGWIQVQRMRPRSQVDHDFTELTGFEPPVSIIAPAHNEEVWIEDAVRCLLQLDYPEFDIIIVNDGSKDRTLEILKEKFHLAPVPTNQVETIDTRGKIIGLYQSMSEPRLRVVDKEAGGTKADASNAGVNYVRYPYFADIDIDTVFQLNSIREVMYPFINDPLTVAAGGVVRTVNGAFVSHGFFLQAGLGKKFLARFQTLEYLRAFIFGRLGWNPMNAVMIISGAYGVFRTELVKELGGYNPDAAGEDMDIIVRIHKHHIRNNIPYKVAYVPLSNCYTEVPEHMSSLYSQRARWHRGLSEVLWRHRILFCHPRGGAISWLAFPYYFLIEWFSPIMEITGFIFIVFGLAMHFMPVNNVVLFIYLAFMTGFLSTLFALLYEEVWFSSFKKTSDTVLMVILAFVENFGYHQFILMARLRGLAQVVFGEKFVWKTIPRIKNFETE